MELQNGQTYKLFVKVIDRTSFDDRFGNCYRHDYGILLAPIGTCLLISAKIEDQIHRPGEIWYDISDIMVLESIS